MQQITLINPFEIADTGEASFLVHWKRAVNFLKSQDGFVSSVLHRNEAGDSRFRYTNVSVWRSHLHFSRAIGRPEFQEILADLDLPHYPALFDLFLSQGDERTARLSA